MEVARAQFVVITLYQYVDFYMVFEDINQLAPLAYFQRRQQGIVEIRPALYIKHATEQDVN